MSEEQPTAATSACPHPEAVGTRWGDPIGDERQAELRALADQQREWAAQPEAERGDSAFKGLRLTGADVYWLAERVRKVDFFKIVPTTTVPDLHLERADFSGAHLERASLREAHLELANLMGAHLEQAFLSNAYLEGAGFQFAHLEKADLLEAHLEGAKLSAARLEKANFFTAHLEGATLAYTHLEGTNFLDAHLEGAKLDSSHLEGKSFAADDPYWQRIRQWMPDFPATLAPANLRGAYFDAATVLNDAVLVDTQHGAVQVADARWAGVNLAVVPDWSPFTERHIPLGDERVAWAWKAAPFSESEAERKRPRKQRTQTRQDHAPGRLKPGWMRSRSRYAPIANLPPPCAPRA